MKTANKKPWGHELLAFQNEDIAIWHLFIDPWQETSLHSHPNKKTGLIVLEGAAEVSFMSGREKLFANEKVMIRQGVFHKTKNMTNHQLELFEIETPVNKDDIVRLKDKYGRSVRFFKEAEKEVSIVYQWDRPDRRKYFSKQIGSCFVKLDQFFKTSRDDYAIVDQSNYLFVAGGIKANDRFVCAPGDILSGSTLSLLVKEFGLLENSEAVRISLNVK